MGGHYGTIHIRTEDTKAVRGALDALTCELNKKFLLAPTIDGWVTVFPEDCGQDFSISDALAQKITAPMLHTVVHDDDVLAYHFHDGGKLIGTYNSCPDYFGESSESRGGDVELLKKILPDAVRRGELKTLLDSPRFTFEIERLEKFVDLLGLPNGVGSYEYLQDGERGGIQRWKDFVHIPDLTAEKNAKQAAKLKAKAEMARLAKDGFLILNVAGGKTDHRIFSSRPIWCIDQSTNDVLLAWTGSPIGVAGLAKVMRVNIHTGKMDYTGINASSHIHCLAASPDGAWLAAGCACGDWKTEIFDLQTGKLVREIPQSRAVSEVCFNRTGRMLYSLSESTITVIDLNAGEAVAKISLPEASQTLLLHPSGDYLVAVCQGLFTLIHLPTQKVLKSLWIEQAPGPMRDLIEHVKAQKIDEQFLKAMPAGSAEELEKRRRQMERHFLPKQPVHSLSFGSLGNCLFCGGRDGVNVILWDKILAASDMEGMKPQAYIPAEQLVREDTTSNNNLIYAMPVDSSAKRVLFAGLEGKVRFMNLPDERLDDLLSPPTKRPFANLQLSPDRTALIGTAISPPQVRSNKREPAYFQIWNYKLLCQAANLSW